VSGAGHTPGLYKPGKLNELQRSYIVDASRFHEGKPIPFADMHIPYQGRSSFVGLVKRGLLEERGRGFYYLTENGYRVARAIHHLMGRNGEVAEIDAHLAAIAKATGAA
jgi:hypothetical protein